MKSHQRPSIQNTDTAHYSFDFLHIQDERALSNTAAATQLCVPKVKSLASKATHVVLGKYGQII